jgi:SH3-like domain-containing protein
MSRILAMTAASRLSLACVLAIALGQSFATGPACAAESSVPVPGVGPVTSLPLPRFVSLRAEQANARRGPSLDQQVDWEFVHRGLPLEVTAEYGQWRRVQDVDGMGGWVHHALLSGVRTVLVRADGAVPLHARPEEGAAVRAMAEPGAIGRLDRCEGTWCEIASGSLSGWLRRTAVWGVGPDETVD